MTLDPKHKSNALTEGPISVQVLAMPTSGRRRSSSVSPVARSIARAGARLAPSVSPALRHFNS